MGDPIETAALSGAVIITPAPLERRLIDKGLKREQFRRAGIGSLPLHFRGYQPDPVILGLSQDPPEFVHVARLMTTNNPKLRTVIPSHMRPGAPIIAEGKRELDCLGIGGLMFAPASQTVYAYS